MVFLKILAVVGFIFVLDQIRRRVFKPKSIEGIDEIEDTSDESQKWSWTNTWKKIIDFWEKGKRTDKDGKPKTHLFQWPLILVGLWIILGLFLKCYHTQWYEPWKWVGWFAGFNYVLFWFLIPIMIGITAGIRELGSKFLTALSFAILILMLCTGYGAYTETKVWKEKSDKVAAKQAEEKKQAEAERIQLVNGKQVLRRIPVIAGVNGEPGPWSKNSFPADGWTREFDPDGNVDFIADDGPIKQDGPDMFVDYGEFTREIWWRVRAGGTKDVVVTVTLVRK